MLRTRSSRRLPRGRVGALLVLACAALAAQPATAATIVEEDFGAGWTAGTTWVAGGNFTPSIYTDNAFSPSTALRLTTGDNGNSVQYRFKTASLTYSIPQPTSGGLDVRFVIAEWGGTGGTVDGADGITFFVRKGSDPSNAIGGTGGALGYAPSNGGNGMPGALLGVGIDMQGNFAQTALSGTGCTGEAVVGNTPNNLTVRGPGQGLAGYCRLGYTTSGVSLGGGTESRAGRARSIRVTVDPASAVNPRVKVYYGSNGTGTTSGTPSLDVAAPAELLAESTFKFGFAAATGSITNNNEVWMLRVDSLVTLPEIEITTTSLPSGTIGTAYSCTTIATANGVAPVAFAVTSGSLPAGLTLNPATGEVCGTPTEAGTRTFTVSATDSRGPTASTTSRPYTITITGGAAEPATTTPAADTRTPAAAPEVEIEKSSAGADTVAVTVAASEAGTISVVGQQRVRSRWVTRCNGEAAVSGRTDAKRVLCVLTPAAHRALCTAPLRLRLTARLTTPATAIESTRAWVRIGKRVCGPSRVTG